MDFLGGILSINTLFFVLAFIVGLIIFVWMMSRVYTVVPAHQAHVVVTRGSGRKVYCSRQGYKSSYWHFSFLQRRSILPLEIIKLTIKDIPLRDKNLAKFKCDVVAWLLIENLEAAAERLGRVEADERSGGFAAVESDIGDFIQAVTRNMTMQFDIVSIMSERKAFSESIARDIADEIKEWGTRVVDLETIHFQDSDNFTVIADLEKRQATVINAETRKLVATKNQEANIVESDAQRLTELSRAENEEKFKTRQIQRDTELGRLDQEKEREIALAQQEANKQKVEATRTLQVGTAQGEAEAKLKTAEGDANATRETGKAAADVSRITGSAEAEVTRIKGSAQAQVIRETAISEAEGIDRRAEAQKKYNEAAMAIEIITKVITAAQAVETQKYMSLGDALKTAKVNVVSTGEKEILGIPVSAETGLALGGMFKALKDSGFDVDSIMKQIGDGVKSIVGTGK